MALPFGIGDFLAVSSLIITTVEKCRSASQEFADLQAILQATYSAVESARYSVADVYERLPAVHQRSIANGIGGIRSIVNDIAQELSHYSRIKPGHGAQLSKLQFALFSEPRTIESKLTMWLSALNKAMAAITVKVFPFQEVSATSSRSSHLIARHMLERWVFWSEVAAGKGTFARGLYDYEATASPMSGGKSEIHLVSHQLTLTHNTVTGTFTDAVGKGMITGRISESGRKVRFIKQYTKHTYGKDLPRWQYEGSFTSHGIADDWHYPGDPPALAIHRGRFAIWLQEDEDGQAGPGDTQLTSLLEHVKILTRSMTFEK